MNQPIDVNTLFGRCMQKTAIAQLLIDKFEKQMHADLDQAQAHLEAGDFRRMRLAAHALKGAAGSLSAAGVQEAAAHVETGPDDRDAAAVALSELRTEVTRCVAYLPAARALVGALATTTDTEKGHSTCES